MNPVQKQATRVLGGTMTTENQKETSSSKSGWTSFKNYLKSWWPWHISPGKHSATQGAALTAKTRGSSRCCLDVQNGSTGHAGHTKSSPRQCAHSQMLRNSICVCVGAHYLSQTTRKIRCQGELYLSLIKHCRSLNTYTSNCSFNLESKVYLIHSFIIQQLLRAFNIKHPCVGDMRGRGQSKINRSVLTLAQFHGGHRTQRCRKLGNYVRDGWLALHLP